MSDPKYAIIMEIIDSGYVNTGRSNYKCIEERYDNWISFLNDLSPFHIHISFLTVFNYFYVFSFFLHK